MTVAVALLLSVAFVLVVYAGIAIAIYLPSRLPAMLLAVRRWWRER